MDEFEKLCCLLAELIETGFGHPENSMSGDIVLPAGYVLVATVPRASIVILNNIGAAAARWSPNDEPTFTGGFIAAGAVITMDRFGPGPIFARQDPAAGAGAIINFLILPKVKI
jgi:hypothetical protein